MKRIRQKMRYVMFVIVASLMFVTSTSVKAQYNHVMTDPEGDVMLETYTDFIEGVERPNIDITLVEMSENNGIITISLTVKGIVTSSAGINYHITLHDGYQWNAVISYNDGICKMEWAENFEDNLKEIYLEANGIGNDTLSINFSLEELGKPSYLYIYRVKTFEYLLDEFDNFEAYMDSREPELHEIPLNNNKIELEDKNNELPGFTFLFLSLAFVVAIVIYHAKKR